MCFMCFKCLTCFICFNVYLADHLSYNVDPVKRLWGPVKDQKGALYQLTIIIIIIIIIKYEAPMRL